MRPCGTAASMAERSGLRLSGRSCDTSDVCTAIMPQPISTPTAAGMIAPLHGMTHPTVAPRPQCTSGITAMWLCTNGSFATFSSWRRAVSSSGTPRVHALIGAPGLSSVLYWAMFPLSPTKNPSADGPGGVAICSLNRSLLRSRTPSRNQVLTPVAASWPHLGRRSYGGGLNH